MRFLVTVTAFETFASPAVVKQLRDVFLRKVRQIRESGKMREGGHILTERAGFFVLDVDSAEELGQLLFPLQDLGRIEARVVEPFEDLERALAENPVQ